MATQTLRDLAREYAKGTLDRESYRRHRTALIDGILAGTIHVDPIDFAAPVVSKSASDTTGPGKRSRKAEATAAAETDALDVFDITRVVPDSGDVTPPRPERAANSRPEPPPSRADANGSQLLVTVGIIALVAVAVLAIALAVRKVDTPATAIPAPESAAVPAGEAESVPEVAEQAPAPTVANPATDAIVEFLKTKNWSDESMDQFQSLWLSLPQTDRDAAAGSGEILQMANALYRKLLEVRALSQVTDAATSQQKQEKLLNFAHNLGINDPRLTPQAATNGSTSN